MGSYFLGQTQGGLPELWVKQSDARHWWGDHMRTSDIYTGGICLAFGLQCPADEQEILVAALFACSPSVSMLATLKRSQNIVSLSAKDLETKHGWGQAGII